jgi:hypothetical protein
MGRVGYRLLVAALVVAASIAAAVPAQAATTIGQTNPGSGCLAASYVQDAIAGPPSYTVPDGGG